jgi:hypothetical protein
VRTGAHHQNIRVPGKARRGTKPGEFARIELDIGVPADKADQRHIAAEQAEGRPIPRRDGIEIVDRAQAARSRHVLRDDRGMPGKVAAEMARQQAPDHVVAAARPVSDDQIDLPAAIELIGRVLCEYRAAKCGRSEQHEAEAQPYGLLRHHAAFAFAGASQGSPKNAERFFGRPHASPRCALPPLRGDACVAPTKASML